MSEEIQPIKKKIELEVEFDTTNKEDKENRFQALLEFADVLDAYRIFPRLFIFAYLYILVTATQWFMLLEDPSTAQAGLISVVVGVGAAWFGLYTSTGSGRKIKSLTTGK